MKINPRMLELARLSRGKTQSHLAKELGITQATYSKVEAGAIDTSNENIAELSNILQYPTSFFTQIGSYYAAGVKYRRSFAKLSKSVASNIDATNNIIARGIGTLYSRVELNLIDIPDYSNFQEYLDGTDAAQKLREKWHLPKGPIDNLTELIESKGIFVVKNDFTTRLLDGVTYEYSTDIPDIIFINSEASADRIRFTLAHELGHKVMHKKVTKYDIVEDQANRFAAEFLMPENDIKNHLKYLDFEELVQLKSIWKVSMKSLIKRAADLGVITPAKARNFYITYNQICRNQEEPHPIQHEQPVLLNKLIDLYKTELEYSSEELAALMNIFPSDYNRYFEPKSSKSAKIYKLNNSF